MASEHSMDIVVDFDFQELKNAVDQAKREAVNRFDLKDANIEIDLTDEAINIKAPSEIQANSVKDIISKKIIGRNLSPKIIKFKKLEEIGGMRVKLHIDLIKSLDQENAKNISKIIRDNFPKAKPNIQGDTVRVVSKSIDDLQAVRQHLINMDMDLPLNFTNYR